MHIVSQKELIRKKKKICVLVIAFLFIIGAATATLLFLLRDKPVSNLEQIEPPTDAQLLIFPVKNGVITAGYRNPTYLEKNGYPHYGLDITSVDGGHAEVLASGTGVVLGTEFCDNSLGNIAVIRYDQVFVPQLGKTVSLIARYYHMASFLLQQGEMVSTGQAIGSFDGKHEWYHHVHIELDTDLAYPFNTPQVAENASELLNRHPASGEKTLDPIWVLAIEQKQKIFVHPNSDCCTEKDNPRFAKSG